VVLVTPTYASAGTTPSTPADKLVFTNDAEANFLGHIENVYGVGPNGTRGSYDGTVGFLLD
jgi:pilus assembly protein CpaC